MRHLLEIRTLMVMLSAALVAVAGIAFAEDGFLPQIFFRCLYFGEILFHELGHTLFFWLFGSAAVPSIMTMIGSDKAGGYSLVIGEHWMIQVLADAAMVYGCYHFRERKLIFYPAVALTVLMVLLSFTSVARWLPIYMGQGGSILAAAVLLYRAWLDVGVHHITERWLNALYGFFITFHNGWFSHQLMGDTAERARYEGAELTNDFVVLADTVPGWTLNGLALSTLILSLLVLVGSFAAAAYFAESERYDAGF